jgi:hypothetical protein
VVTVTTLRADERLYYPVHAVPYTPAKHFAKGKSDPGFRTKLAIGADLAARARAAGFTFRAVAADSAYGDQDGFRSELADAGLPFVMALKPRRGTWAYGPDAPTPVDASRALAWGGPDDPGDWHPMARTFRDGHAETWYAAEATLGWRGPDGARRLAVATADPGTLPGKANWVMMKSSKAFLSPLDIRITTASIKGRLDSMIADAEAAGEAGLPAFPDPPSSSGLVRGRSALDGAPVPRCCLGSRRGTYTDT